MISPDFPAYVRARTGHRRSSQFTDRYIEPRFAEGFKELADAVKAVVRQVAKVDFEDTPPDYFPRSCCVTEGQINEAVARLEAFDFLGVTEDLSSSIAQIARLRSECCAAGNRL